MQFACPQCAENIKARDDQAGEDILCPKCQQQITVPAGAPVAPKAQDDWDILDEEEKFFEEAAKQPVEHSYRTREDELDPVVDNDDQVIAEERREEEKAITDILSQTQNVNVSAGAVSASNLTIQEKIEQEEKRKKNIDDEVKNAMPVSNWTAAKQKKSTDQDASKKDIKFGNDTSGSLKAKCYVCDSVSYVHASKAGGRIICSDCGSPVDVPVPVENTEETQEKSKPDGHLWIDKKETDAIQQRKINDELFIDAPGDGDEYGLAPMVDDPLAANQPQVIEELEILPEPPLGETPPMNDSEQSVGDVPATEMPINVPVMPAIPASQTGAANDSLVEEDDLLGLESEEDLPALAPLDPTPPKATDTYSGLLESAMADPLKPRSVSTGQSGSGPSEKNQGGSNSARSNFADHSSSEGEHDYSSSRPIKDKSETVTSDLFEEMQAEKKSKGFQKQAWGKHIFGVVTDPGFWVRSLLTSIFLLLPVWIYQFSKIFSEGESGMAQTLGAFIQIPAVPLAAVALVGICAFGQAIINMTLVGDDEFGEMGGFSPLEWVSNAMFVLVSFGLCAIPGIFVGALAMFGFENNGIWMIPAFASLTGLVLLPLPLLSALVNRSPFKISNAEMSKTFSTHSDAWVEFYPVAGLTAILISSFWFIGLSNNVMLISTFCLLIALGYGFYFRMFGRLMGTIVNQPARKEKKATSKD